MSYQYNISYAPTNRATCKFCGKKIEKGSLRISRESGPIFAFGGDANLIQHYHWRHAFKVMEKSRCTSNVMSPGNMKIYSTLTESDKKMLTKEREKFTKFWKNKCRSSSIKKISTRKKSKSKRRSSRR